MRKIYGTKSQLARILNCDVRSAAIASRQPDSYLQSGNKTVGVYLLGTAATAEQESDLAEMRKLTGLERTTRARKLEAKHGKGWELLCTGEANKPAKAAPVKSPKKVAAKAKSDLNVANLVAPNPTNTVSTKPTNGIF